MFKEKRIRLHNLLNKDYIVRHPEDIPKHFALYAVQQSIFWVFSIIFAWLVCYFVMSLLT